jgi:RNA polymerase sigma factor (sigma-70 family)
MANCTDPSRGASEALDELSQNHAAYRERLAKELCRTFRSYRLTRDEAWDLADRALEKAVRSIARFDPTRKVKLTTWLHTIARRCARDHVELSERRRATVSTDDEKVERSISVSGPSEMYRMEKLNDALCAAVARSRTCGT